MPIRRVLAHEKMKINAGKGALERGPIVYCLEWPDNDVDSIFDLRVNDDEILTFEYRKDLLNGLIIVKGKDFVAIPYYAWAHRGKGEMVVWINRNPNK